MSFYICAQALNVGFSCDWGACSAMRSWHRESDAALVCLITTHLRGCCSTSRLVVLSIRKSGYYYATTCWNTMPNRFTSFLDWLIRLPLITSNLAMVDIVTEEGSIYVTSFNQVVWIKGPVIPYNDSKCRCKKVKQDWSQFAVTAS